MSALKHRTYQLVIDKPYEYVDTSLPTASWWDRYTVQPGTYDVRLTNISGTTWNPDPDVVTPGFIANTGPYYAEVEFDVVLEETHRVNRLLQHSTAHTEERHERTTIRRNIYAYQLDTMESWMGGTIVTEG